MFICDVCGQPGTLLCSGCHESYYCSKVCQKRAWVDHKHLCKTLDDSRSPPAATDITDGYMRAIYFPSDEEKPRFVWLPFKTVTAGSLVMDIGSHLAMTDEEKDSGLCVTSGWEDVNRVIGINQYLPYTIRMHYRNSHIDNVPKPSTSVRKVSDSRSPMFHNWAGPMIAHGIKDFTSDSLPLGAAARKKGGNPSLSEILRSFTPSKPRGYVNCVRVNCDGDVKIGGRPRFETVILSEKHAIFKQAPTSTSARVEMPVAMARIPGSVKIWTVKGKGKGNEDRVAGPHKKEVVTAMWVAWGLEGTLGRETARTWSAPVGSVIIARKDQKPLMPEHAEALADFCQNHLIDRFQELRESKHGVPESIPGLTTDHVLGEITKEKFLEYYGTWKAQQTDEVKRDQISPYDV
jgi:hypothetical protein